MHLKCYYSYHTVRYGVYLDNRYKINRTRRRQKTIKEIARRDGMFLWYKVSKDIHLSVEEYGSHGSQDGPQRLSSGEVEETGAEPGQGLVNEQPPQLPNAACPG